MNNHDIEQNVKRIIENFSKENFLYDLLLAYGISKTSITRLKLNSDNGLQTRWTRTPAGNSRLAQWRVLWLMERSVWRKCSKRITCDNYGASF